MSILWVIFVVEAGSLTVILLDVDSEIFRVAGD